MIETDEVDVIDGRDTDAPPLRFHDEDFDPHVSFLRSPHDGRCRLFATEWVWSDDVHRGGGFYITGQWFDVGGGTLRPVAARPVLARRALFSFVTERAHGNAYEWLRSAKAEPLVSWPPEAAGVLRALDDTTVTIDTANGTRIIKRDQVRFVDDVTGRAWPGDYRPRDDSLLGRRVDVITGEEITRIRIGNRLPRPARLPK